MRVRRPAVALQIALQGIKRPSCADQAEAVRTQSLHVAGFLWQEAISACAGAGDDSIWLDDEILTCRGGMVELYQQGDRSDCAREPRAAGCHGLPMIKKWLPYVDLSTLFPVAHCVLYGLVKDFFTLVLAPFPKGETSDQRFKQICTTCPHHFFWFSRTNTIQHR